MQESDVPSKIEVTLSQKIKTFFKMEEDLNLLTKKKLIELAKHLGVSTSGTKSDIIDRLERQRNKSVKKKPKKLTDEEYFRQKEILEQELEIERLNQIKRDHERKLKFLKLESLRHGDDIEKSDESLEESSDEDEDTAKGAVAKKPQGKKSQQPLDKNASILELLSLPKPSLMEFDGDPMQYHMFKNSFDAVIDSANISDSAKLNRLFELCKGTAREVILPCALGDPSDGYAEARELLKERFGDSYAISEAFIDKLTSGGPIKQHEVSALRRFADEIRSCVRTLSAMDMLGEIDTRIRMVKLTERLPYAMQGRWRTKAIRTRREKGAYPDINEFLEFVEDCVEEASDPVFGVKQRESSKRDSSTSRHKEDKIDRSTIERYSGFNRNRTTTSKTSALPTMPRKSPALHVLQIQRTKTTRPFETGERKVSLHKLSETRTCCERLPKSTCLQNW